MKRRNFALFLRLLGLLVFVVGVYLLWDFGWKIIVGLYLLIWSNSLGEKAKKFDDPKLGG